MKNLFLFLLLLLINTIDGNGQNKNITLSCWDTEPRLNEYFEVHLDITFLSESVSKIIPDKIIFGFPEKCITIRMKAKETGVNTIGPFSFDFNGIKYTTNALKLNIAPPIDYKKDSIYLRYVESDSVSYIILEQVKIVPSIDEDSTFFDGCFFKDIGFVELKNVSKNDILKDNYIKVNDLYFSTHGRILRQSDSYQMIREVFKVINKTCQDILLSRDYFLNIPSNMSIPRIIIKPQK